MPPEYLIQDRPNEGHAPNRKVDELRSFGMPQRQWPDPPPEPPKPKPPPGPASTREQMRSAYFDPPRQTAADLPAAGKATRAQSPRPMNRAAQTSSSIFGEPSYATPPPPPPKPVEQMPTSTVEQMVSCVFGTPRRHERPQTPRRNSAGPMNSLSAQGLSTVFGSPRYTSPPPQSPRRPTVMANSMTAQGRSSSLPGTDFSSFEPTRGPKKPPPAIPTDSVAQNESTVFGTPRRPTPAPVVSNLSSGGGGAVKSYAPGEFLMPTPREGAPTSKFAENISSSLPATRYPPPPPKPPKEPPPPAATSAAENGRSSSLPGTDWSKYEGAAKQKPEAWPNAPDPGTKAGRNVSSVFGPPQIVTPPLQPPKPVPTIATSTVAQQQSSVFGSPRYPSPRPVQPKYASSLHMDAPRAASPIRPRHKPKDPVLLGANGRPRAPNSNAEMQVSSVLGGSLGADTQALMHDQHRVSKSLLRVEFTGLPPDCNTSRLHMSLSALPFDKGVTCDVNKVRVPYDAINGRGVGSGRAEFKSVPDKERLLRALKTGQEKGWLKATGWKVTYDDTKVHTVSC